MSYPIPPSPPRFHNVVICHLLANPPSPSDDCVTYEQPLRCFSFLSYFQGVCFGYQARKIFCVLTGRLKMVNAFCQSIFFIKISCEFCFQKVIYQTSGGIYTLPGISSKVTFYTFRLNLHVFTYQAEGPAFQAHLTRQDLFLMRSKLKYRRQSNDSKKSSSPPYQLNTQQFRRWCREGKGEH